MKSVIRLAGLLCTLFLFVATAADTPALAHFQARNFREAEQAYRLAIRRQPRNPELHLGLARTLVELNRIPEALQILETTLATTPSGLGPSPATEMEAGRLLRRLADKRFRDLDLSGQGQAAINEIAGKRLEREGNFTAALAQYREAQQREPNRAGIQYLIGGALWKLRDFEAAEKHLRAELANTPGHGMANFRLGQIMIANSLESESVPYLERALAALPARLEVRRELGKAYRKTGNLAGARSVWEQVAKARPQDDQVHFLLGGLYREMGEAELSQKEFNLHRQLLEQRRSRSERR